MLITHISRISMVVGSVSLLTACTTQHTPTADFTPSVAHLNTQINTQTIPDTISTETMIKPMIISSIPKPIPLDQKPNTHTTESNYQLRFIHAPLRNLLQKFSLDAHILLDIDAQVTGQISVTLQEHDPIKLLYRICDQAGLLLEEQSSDAGMPSYRVSVDHPYWVNHTIDYVNIERQVSSSLMVANALGSISGKASQAVTLGGQANMPVAVSQGSSTALLNQSKYNVWTNLQQGISLLLRAKHPELILSSPTTPPSTAQTTQSANDADSDVQLTHQQEAGKQEVLLRSDNSEPTSLLGNHLPKLSDSAVYPLGTSVQDLLHISREGGFIAVFAPRRTQQEIAQFIQQTQASIDRQVIIEATILEVELNDEHQAGINWQALVDGQGLNIISAFTGRDQNDFTSSQSAGLVSMTGTAISKDFSLASTLKLLERYGNSRVLSSPKIMMMNHQPSLIKVVKNLVYFTMQAQVIAGQTGQASTRAYVSTPNTVPIGLVMSVIPSISANHRVTLAVRPTISSLSGVVDDPNPDLGDIPNRVPIIQERELESVLSLVDGQVAVLGGLIQDVIAEEDTGIPGLISSSSIGFLFGQKNKAKRKSELVIFLKPTLIATTNR